MTDLINSGATHNFINERLVAKMESKTGDFEGFNVMVADGYTLPCNQKIQHLKLTLGGHKMRDNFYVIGIGNTKVVLRVQWLHSLGEYTQNSQIMEPMFKSNGKEVVLHSLSNGGPMVVSTK